MMDWTNHLLIAPILLPLVSAAVMLLLGAERRRRIVFLNVASTVTLLGIAVLLLGRGWHADSAVTGVYLLGNWPSSFGIVLVADRLSILMLTLTSMLALASLTFSLARWHRAGPYFHPIFQILLMGLNGAFLTGDLFNLFVFFELLLAASFGLVLHGSSAPRIRAGLHYIAISLTGSMLFLIGVALIYSVTGTLNMAELAVRIPAVADADRALLEAGAAILGIAFLLKSGMWPLNFWLPTTYAAASAPAAAMFAIMSKVGIYAVLRLWLLLFGDDAGASSAFGGDWLLVGGLLTIAFGAISALGSQDSARLGGYCLLISSGTLLAAIGIAEARVTGAALYYLVSSTFGISAYFLLIELAERDRAPGADVLAVTMEALGHGKEDEVLEADEPGVPIPGAMSILGLAFVTCALILAGLPPVSGFIGKFALLTALLNPVGAGADDPLATVRWVVLVLVILSGLTVIIAMARAGIRTFWAPPERPVPRVRLSELSPIAVLLLVCAVMTVQAGPIMGYMQQTADALHAPGDYRQQVRDAVPVQRPVPEGGE